ncbi:MAG: flavodoxin family protein [Candidatus Heimdallarchaeota archaeon]
MKALVVYYSFEGATKLIGDAIAEELGADVLELKLVKEVESKEYMKNYLGGKQVLMKTTPLLKDYELNINEFEMIIIGTPIWSGTYSPAIRTFITQEKLKDKKLGFFYTFSVKAGLIAENFAKNLKGNIVVAKIGFRDPLKRNPELAVERAKRWAQDLNSEFITK